MDYMNNPTERDQQIAREAARTKFAKDEADGYLQRRGWNLPDCIQVTEPELATLILAAIQDAKQQGNEDAARLDWLHINGIQALLNVPMRADMREWLDAARGVQPAAKEGYSDVRQKIRQAIRPEIDAIRDSETLTADDLSVRIGAAQQESAPAAEQPLICSACLFDIGTCPSCGTYWVREGEKRTGYRRVK